MLDYLSRKHDVRLVCFRRGELTPAQQQWAAGFGEVATVQLDKGRNAWNLLKSYVSRVPISIERNRSTQMQSLVLDTRKDWWPQVIFVDSWLMAQYLPPEFDGLRLLHEHNAEFQLWDRQAERETNVRKQLARREADRVRKYEQDILRSFDVVFTVSEQDKGELHDLGVEREKLRILPNIPDRALLDAPLPEFERTEPLVLYLGTLSWQPNIEGVERFAGSVFPMVRKRYPNARLIVAGRGASPALAQKVANVPGAEFAGEVDDPEEYYAQARVFVDATRSGGGTRLKILNAMARGIPVVASQQAAQGLDIVAGEHLIIARNDHSMADAVVTLLVDGVRWKILSQNGRALVRSRYVAETAFRVLDEVLAGAAK